MNESPPLESSQQTLYPACRSFIVQIEAHSGNSPDVFQGRAEHMVSGKGCKFDSLLGLLEFMRCTLENHPDGK